MDPFRVYVKITIQEGKFEEFQALIPSFVETIKDTEPQALQFEGFANEANREIIWLQSYIDNKGFDVHLANLAVDESKLRMMSLQETIVNMHFMSAPTFATTTSLQQYGIQASVLDPWPGTIRLTEARNEDTHIQSFATVDLSDMEAYRKISEQVEAAAANQPGVLFHRSYHISDSRVAVYEEYRDSDSLLTWAEVFAANSGNFGNLVKAMTNDVCGNPSAPCKEMLGAWGAVFYKKVAGFSRFN